MLVPFTAFHAHKASDKDITRYALGGVRLTRINGDPVACATDGRKLLVLGWDEQVDYPADVSTEKFDGDDGVIIPASVCKEMARPFANASERRTKPVLENVHVKEDVKLVFTRASGSNGANVQEVVPLDGRFPNIQDVIKCMHPDGPSFKVNAVYFRDLLDVLIKYVPEQDGNGLCVTITPPSSKCGGMLITADNGGKRAWACQMPMVADKEEVKPAWKPC